ncbi:hypothetical protein CVT26_015856 [Gymnopilus dilepis]|uniref:PSP1 C-terminal domain-containing protein n=1 Tax=Gymnopilus dilepis TaxID=231916 RepID=A0A409XYG4_9AGAR|nr:hypothetical protein CVT26_015856 [Gymnopilus dilepis]
MHHVMPYRACDVGADISVDDQSVWGLHVFYSFYLSFLPPFPLLLSLPTILQPPLESIANPPPPPRLLATKQEDEAKALALCQTKVRAKKLPMEVIDAEYQWDRRKLTFYFVAEKRIDFRELARCVACPALSSSFRAGAERDVASISHSTAGTRPLNLGLLRATVLTLLSSQ